MNEKVIEIEERYKDYCNIITNLENGDSEIYLPGTSPKGEFSKYADEIESLIKDNKPSIIISTDKTIEDPSVFALEKFGLFDIFFRSGRFVFLG